MRKNVSVSVLLFVVSINLFGQISPPGLDNTNLAFWSAMAVSQKLSDKWNLTVYAGQARESDPDNYALVKKQAIFVLNEETMFRVNQKFAVSLCASYRIQNRYAEASPYEAEDPDLKNEERYYLRFYLNENVGKTKLTFSLRPELRLYSGSHHSVWKPTDEELRFRLKGQASVPFGKTGNQFIVANEILSVTDHEINGSDSHWTPYNFTEDRLSMYYRRNFGKVTTDLGLMHQIKFDGTYILHLAVDFILNNPFGEK